MKKEANLLKIKRNTLLVCNFVLVEKNCTTITNLETTVQLKTDYDGDPKLIDIEMYNLQGHTRPTGKSVNLDNWPMLPKLGEFNQVEKLSFDLSDVQNLQKAVNFVTNDDLRPVMTGILISEHIVATDAHKLFCRPYMGYNVDQSSIIIPIDVIKLLKLHKVKTFELTHDQKNGQIKYNDYIITFRLIDGKYPNYKAVIPESTLFSTTVMRKQLINSLKALLPISNKCTNMVELTFIASTELKLFTCDFDREIEEAIILQSNNVVNDNDTIAFNIKFLLTCLNNLDNEEVTIHFNAMNKGALIDDILLMPTLFNA